ncbi:gamma-glutamylcyclotransferase 2-3 isoform X2 [Cucumis sativus]|uniref:gamma-glutamylcyclotransferase 2-3 isoform X2 n=1 Tax=Cucumis sativus TaxID=3659 RepID=UPI0012F4FC6C|nr:gamma-glutamylcyclotransferase 2-3 isoform X2 [Cucumis sativus]
MVMWVFGYGSLIWKTGFPFDQKLPGCIKGYRRVFYQGSTDHRGTPEFPGRTVTLEAAEGEVCHLEVREKQYDRKEYVDFFTDPMDTTTPVVSGVMVYIASPDKKLNKNYLGPASIEEIAKQVVHAEGPSGPNKDYIFQLEKALLQFGWDDKHVTDLANEVRSLLSDGKQTAA